ncbi:MAG: hypothetical protein ACRDMV_05350 [Streptosporangiales bacterium]
MSGYLDAFALTCAVELPVYCALLMLLARVPAYAAVGLGLAVNVVTHPLLWLAFDGAGRVPYVAAFGVGELAVCAAEWALLAVSLRRRAVGRGVLAAVVVVANGLSAAVGLLVDLLG